MTNGWTKTLLGQVITLQRGFDLPQRLRSTGTFPIVSSSGITGHHSEFKVHGPGVVTGRYGTLGEVFYLETDFWPLNTTLWVKDFKGNAPEFVSYLLRTLNLGHHNAAGAVPGLNRNALHLLPVTLPPRMIQKRIAALLRVYDDLIENSNRRIKILEEMVQMIYREWFVSFRFPGHEQVKLVESEVGQIPKGWTVAKLSSLVETQYGYTESANNMPVGPKYLRGMDINKSSYILWDKVPYCPMPPQEIEIYKLSRGDIVVIRMADPGKVGIVEKEVEAVFASYLIRLKIRDNRLTPYYLFHFLRSDRYQDYVSGASTGTTRKSASAGVITDIKILIPPPDLAEEFGKLVGSMREMLNNLLDQNSNLQKSHDLLLLKLISGEVSVERFEIETANQIS
jgi:type I restriction enzyme, S subunit